MYASRIQTQVLPKLGDLNSSIDSSNLTTLRGTASYEVRIFHFTLFALFFVMSILA